MRSIEEMVGREQQQIVCVLIYHAVTIFRQTQAIASRGPPFAPCNGLKQETCHASRFGFRND
jgi:hypothetical protein